MIALTRPPCINRRGVLSTALGLLAAPSIVRAQQSAGVALVIGNSKYKWEASLPNVKRDAPDIAKAFQSLGLKTEVVQDVGREALRAAVDKFAAAARGANLAAFYFAGHGASWDKDTYLVPVDADLANPSTVRSLLSVSAVRDAVKDARHRLLVFDNCRNNPADGWRQRDLMIQARAEAADQAGALLSSPDTLVLYSTASGRTALDGPPGENSPFAAGLLRQLQAPSVDLQALPGKLRRDLLIATECRQLVWDQNTYTAPFLLNVTAKPAPSTAGLGGDTSRMVEPRNAYTFARDKGLLLPPGLIAYRAPPGSPHAQKVGTFQSAVKSAVGTMGTSIQPATLIVMSVADDNTAQMVEASKEWRVFSGAYWRFVQGTLSGDRVTWPGVGATGTVGEASTPTRNSGGAMQIQASLSAQPSLASGMGSGWAV
jgi:hypothetical protein